MAVSGDIITSDPLSAGEARSANERTSSEKIDTLSGDDSAGSRTPEWMPSKKIKLYVENLEAAAKQSMAATENELCPPSIADSSSSTPDSALGASSQPSTMSEASTDTGIEADNAESAALPVMLRHFATYPKSRQRPPPAGSRSASMPPNGGGASSSKVTNVVPLPKPAEAKRGISVLLTFTDDSHKHVERVIRLGECLRRNGFAVTVDMPQQCFPTTAEAEHFLRCRFEASDYVMICVSQKYKIETESASISGESYHSRYVFEMILNSFRASGQQHPQLLCILLQDADESHLPYMLQRVRPLCYRWPRDYKDVLFCVSKPQRLFEMPAFPDLKHMLPDGCELD